MKKFLNHSGNHIMIGFVLFAIFMIVISIKAMSVKVDLAVEGDYYQQEVNFDDQISARKQGDKLGEGFKLNQESDKLVLEIPADLSQNLENGVVEFFCLSDSKSDTRKLLEKNSDGKYYFNRKESAPGNNYIVKVAFSANETAYYKEFRIL